jgi:hypothetical protein
MKIPRNKSIFIIDTAHNSNYLIAIYNATATGMGNFYDKVGGTFNTHFVLKG